MAKTALGRGLSALIQNKNTNFESNLQVMKVSNIFPNPSQPRKFIEDESFKELVASVRQFGVLQPLIVKEKDDKFEIIAGERRYRAAVGVGINEIPVVVKRVKSDIESFEIALIENIQRQDLSALEEARAFRYLLDDCGVSQDKLSKQLGKSRSYIANFVRLLALDEHVLKLLEENKLNASHARSLVVFDPVKQRALANKIVEEGLSVRQVEELASDKKSPSKNVSDSYDKNDDFSFLEDQLSKSLGSKVKVNSKNSKGKIVVHFANYKELNDLKKKLL